MQANVTWELLALILSGAITKAFLDLPIMLPLLGARHQTIKLDKPSHEALARALQSFLSDDDALREQAVAAFHRINDPVARFLLLDGVVAKARQIGLWDRAVSALKAMKGVEHLKWALATNKQPTMRRHLVELLGLVSDRWDGLVILVLRDVLVRKGEHKLVKEAARAALLRVAPDGLWPDHGIDSPSRHADQCGHLASSHCDVTRDGRA